MYKLTTSKYLKGRFVINNNKLGKLILYQVADL